MASNPFDIVGQGKSAWNTAQRSYKMGTKLGREIRVSRVYPKVEAELGEEVARMVAHAIRAGQDPQAIIDKARRAKKEAEERRTLLANPPPLFGSARFAATEELDGVLREREAFDHPSSILLGAYEDTDRLERPRFVHWDEHGHLMTLAPSRTGKAITTIVPNLLRYKGSVVVFDPKGELYALTSRWRRDNVGPVYRLAPFDHGDEPDSAGFCRHGFNPLAHIRSPSEARELAAQLFPRDPKAIEFFTEDAVSFVTAVILYVMEAAPPELRTLAEVRKFLSSPENVLRELVEDMRRSSHESVVEAADNVLGKSRDRGLPNLRDTLHSKFSMWSDTDIVANVSRDDFDFADLKRGPATVYIEVPIEKISTFAPWVRVVLQSALDAMLRVRRVPEIPVLFILDEFLSLGPFTEFRNAIRTHAGAGVRLWFFLQDLGTLEEHYPNGGWRPFLTCAVKQYFGTNDFNTAELISRTLGQKTIAYMASTAGGNVSAQGGGWMRDSQGTNVGFSTGESIQYAATPLMQPDQIKALLSGWSGKGLRRGLVELSAARPFVTFLSSYENSKTCMDRVGPALAEGQR